MRGKKLLAAFLLGVGLCFVPVFGYGEISQWKPTSVGWYMEEYSEDPAKGLDLWREDCDLRLVTYLDFCLLWATTDYIMNNPNNFLHIRIKYDATGSEKEFYPAGIDATGKISIYIRDTRNYFSGMSGIALKEEFKKVLEVIYSYIYVWATDMNTDIVAQLYSKGEIPLGYFYQGEYHLWGEK